MTFTTRVKDEMSKNEFNPIEISSIISAYILTCGKFSKDKIELTSENASITRLIYRCLKQNYGINPIVNIRIQKRFRVKQIYILIIKEKVDIIVDGGKSPIGVASTIVRVENNEIKILREGHLKVE